MVPRHHRPGTMGVRGGSLTDGKVSIQLGQVYINNMRYEGHRPKHARRRDHGRPSPPHVPCHGATILEEI